MRVLAITAHPHDAELMCGGTLLKCKERGDEVFVCHLTGKSEVCEAGKIGGYTVICGGLNMGEIFSECDETRHQVSEIIRTVNPDFIITHFPNDASPDNSAVSQLVFDASFCASIPHYPSKIEKPTDVVPIFYMQPEACIDFVPNFYVDITNEYDAKIKLVKLNKYADEEKAETLAKFRGLQCNAKYAEAFVQCRASLKMRINRMLP